MKKLIRFTAMILAVMCLFTAIPLTASADLQTGAQRFGGRTSASDAEALQAFYDDLCQRAYEFDEDLALPELRHMFALDDMEYMYIQAQRGTARGQKLYAYPDEREEPQWFAKDGCLVLVYARYGDWLFVELMMNEDDSEGTIAWVPATYVVSKWSASVSRQRTIATRGY